MATTTKSLAPSNANLTAFKAWAQGIDDVFSTFGWTRTSDTGQVDWGTIAAVPAVGTTVYSIWQATDIHQTLCPIYIKMEYGSGSSATTNVFYAVTFGMSTDGAGNLTSASSRMFPMSTTGQAGSATPSTCYFSGDTDRIAMVIFPDAASTNHKMGFVVERSRDVTGGTTNEYWTMVMEAYQAGGSTQGKGRQMSFLRGPAVTLELSSPSVVSGQGLGTNTSIVGNSAYYSPVYPLVGAVGNPMITCGCARKVDFTDTSEFTVTMYGVSRNLKAILGQNTSGLPFAMFGNQDTSANSGFVIGWF